MSGEAERGPIALAERILALLDEGSFTATYKYAVLLALIDLCLENTTARGAPPEQLTTRQLAEKIVELYWPHTVPYHTGSDLIVLLQNRGRRDSQAAIICYIRKFRESEGLEDPWAPLARARIRAPRAYRRLLDRVEWKLVQMPLPRLQIIGGRQDPFLYSIGWDQDVEPAEVRAYQNGERSPFDNRILLGAGVGQNLVRLNGLLRPLIHKQWAAMVARINGLEEAQLERFLFGVERIPLDPVKPGLRELQANRCFYCAVRLGDAGRRAPEVDHFIPWARYPNNAIQNLVLAHGSCNGDKRDFLAAAAHLEAWRARIEPEGSVARQLVELSEEVGWERDVEKSLSVARAIYYGLPDGYQLWAAPGAFDPFDRRAVQALLA